MSNKKAKMLYNELLDSLKDYTSPCSGIGDKFDTDESIPLDERKWNEPIAKDICKTCKLIYLCLDYAIEANETHGIWGGMTPTEREKIKPLTKRI